MGRNIIPYQSSERRRGQALILSVLIMVFIVLLGTTFIAIVSSNMSNTARTASKDQARLAAQAGISFADAQLTGSPNGLGWRPELVNPPAAPGDGFYWTALDRAQGWSSPSSFYMTAIGSSTAAEYVKFPNPLQRVSTENASHFMIRVSQVEWDDPDNNSETKTGDIRIESIGFANDDQTAFYRMVAYKKGSASNPLTAAMRSVSNWDFDGNAIPQGTTTVATTGSTLELTNVQGSFSKDDFVTVFDPTSNQMGYGQVSTATTSGTGSTILNVTGLTMATGAGTVVQRAAQLGIPDAFGIDYDNDTTTPNTPVDFRISGLKNTAGTDVNTSGSVWVNGGLVWYGQNHATNLVAPSPTNIASNILVSGVFASSAGASVQATDSTGTVNAAIPATSIDTGFTGNTTVTSGLLNDGYNRMRGSLDPTRQVHSFTPPDITAGGDGFGRYRQLTQYSPSTDPSNPQASAYGYGEGIYINNPDDVEKVGSTPMSQEQLHSLWFPGTGTTNFMRLGTPDAANSIPNPAVNGTGGSLEEQHARGWVSPDQFLPRGAEVIINNDNTITINLDPFDDNSAAYIHANFASSAPTPNPAKSWKNLDGSLRGDVNTGGVYSWTFNWPANGTLFAEGNIRIRGVNTTAPSSLTVVSMNNIYIDGSLKLSNATTGNPKVLLLAKKNVIVNPTLTLAPVQAVTTLSADTVGGADTIEVYDLSNFRIGDYLTLPGTNSSFGITNKSADIGAGTLTLNRVLPATVRIAGTLVQSVFDPRTFTGFYTTTWTNRPYNAAIRLAKDNEVIQRRIRFAPGTIIPTNLRLAFRHSAEYKKALTISAKKETTGATPVPDVLESAAIANKLVTTSPESIIQTAEKLLSVDFVTNPTGTTPETFPQPLPIDQATADSKTLDVLEADMETTHPAPSWHYDVTVENNYGTVTKRPPYYYMASVGNRYKFGTPVPAPTPVPGTLPIHRNIFDTNMFTIPMATSVFLAMNGSAIQLQDNYWNTSLGGLGIVNRFGFNSVFVDTGDPTQAYEDVLTADQYFYQPRKIVPGDPADPTIPTTAGVENITTDPDYPGSNYEEQRKYDTEDTTKDYTTHYTLDSRVLIGTAPIVGDNDVAMALNGLENFDAKGTYNDTASAPIPYYRLSNLKLQNEVMSGDPGVMTQMGSGTALDINAYVYAQEGGWYVIPGTNFDDNVKNNSDLNRDGIISPGESIAAYRYNRYNYQIVFTGAIMENRTAPPTDVEKWTDKWATVKMDDLATAPTYVSGDPATSNLNTILYYYDPAAAQSALDAGFHVPVANGDLIYQG